MDDSELVPAEFDLSAREIIYKVDAFEAEAEAARQQLIRDRSLALGVIVQKLALAHNGLGDPEVDPAELKSKAARLIGELGVFGTIIIPSSAWTSEQAIALQKTA